MLLQAFLRATAEGDLEGLVALLAEDAVLRSDGGGKVAAALRPIEGADKIARFLVGIVKKFGDQYAEFRLMEINGNPGLVAYIGGAPASVLTFDVADGRVADIYIVRNPDKLRALPRSTEGQQSAVDRSVGRHRTPFRRNS